MKQLTKNVITREEAMELAPQYVRFVENIYLTKRELNHIDDFLEGFNALKVGDNVVSSLTVEGQPRQYVRARVTKATRMDMRAIDGPVVRVTNGEMSWRVDGCDYAQKI